MQIQFASRSNRTPWAYGQFSDVRNELFYTKEVLLTTLLISETLSGKSKDAIILNFYAAIDHCQQCSNGDFIVSSNNYSYLGFMFV